MQKMRAEGLKRRESGNAAVDKNATEEKKNELESPQFEFWNGRPGPPGWVRHSIEGARAKQMELLETHCQPLNHMQINSVEGGSTFLLTPSQNPSELRRLSHTTEISQRTIFSKIRDHVRAHLPEPEHIEREVLIDKEKKRVLHD